MGGETKPLESFFEERRREFMGPPAMLTMEMAAINASMIVLKLAPGWLFFLSFLAFLGGLV